VWISCHISPHQKQHVTNPCTSLQSPSTHTRTHVLLTRAHARTGSLAWRHQQRPAHSQLAPAASGSRWRGLWAPRAWRSQLTARTASSPQVGWRARVAVRGRGGGGAVRGAGQGWAPTRCAGWLQGRLHRASDTTPQPLSSSYTHSRQDQTVASTHTHSPPPTRPHADAHFAEVYRRANQQQMYHAALLAVAPFTKCVCSGARDAAQHSRRRVC
jgi:hypothetical protein